MKKRALSLFLAVLMLITVLPLASAANMTFRDVPESAWYYAEVKKAVELDLINGKPGDVFAPNDDLTYAEAVKLAAAMHQKYTEGSVTLKNGSPWYQTYADYCRTRGIIVRDYDWNAPASRAGYMEIFANALPDSALAGINTVTDGSIPDVPMSHPQAAAIYKLYRAGILQGSADYVGGVLTEHLCKPSDNIRRSEVAAILVRMMDPSARIGFSMGAEPALTVTIPASAAGAAGTAVTVAGTVEGGRAPYTYRWQFSYDGASWLNGTAGTAASFQYTIAANAAAQYIRLSVTDAAGRTALSNICTVAVDTNLTASIPASVSGAAGTAVTISPTVTGGRTPYTYAWQFSTDGTNWYVGPTAKNYAYTPTSTPATQYVRLIVKDAAGKSVTTNICAVTLSAVPVVTTDKTGSVTAAPGDFTAKASVSGGKAPYTYQWQLSTNGKDYADISGATAAALSHKFTSAGTFYLRVRVKDAAGQTAFSPAFTLVVSPVLTVKTDRTGTVNAAPGVFTANATASGGRAPYTWQWQLSTNGRDFTNIYNANAAKLSYTFSSGGTCILRVQVKDADGQTAVSAPFTLVITAAKPLTVTTDRTGTVNMAPGTFTAKATAAGGTAPYTWQWQYSSDGRDFYDVLGADSASFSYSFPSAGTYILRVRVRDAGGQTAYSGAFTLVVSTSNPLTVTTDKTGTVSVPTGRFTASASASGGKAPYTWQWQYSSDGREFYDIPGATASALSYNLPTARTYILRVKVTDAAGQTAYSGAFTLVVTEVKALTVTASKTGTVTTDPGIFTVSASASGGKAPYTWQWQLSTNGRSYSDVAGAESPSFSHIFTGRGTCFLRVQVRDAGGQTAYSAPITVVIADAGQPLDVRLIPGGTIRKNVGDLIDIKAAVSGGGDTCTYAWNYSINGIQAGTLPDTDDTLDSFFCIVECTVVITCTVTSGNQVRSASVTVVITSPNH